MIHRLEAQSKVIDELFTELAIEPMISENLSRLHITEIFEVEHVNMMLEALRNSNITTLKEFYFAKSPTNEQTFQTLAHIIRR